MWAIEATDRKGVAGHAERVARPKTLSAGHWLKRTPGLIARRCLPGRDSRCYAPTGGARGTLGPAAIGYVIDDHAGVRVVEHAERTGTTTAAEAEYRALLAGLARVHELGLTRVTARSDSKLLIAHVSGDGHVRNARLVGLAAEIINWRMRIGTVLFDWVPATANGEAHQLVAGALELPTD